MKRGFGTLLVLALGMMLFANPSTTLQSPKPAAGSSSPITQQPPRNGGDTSLNPNMEICKNADDGTCPGCTGICPSEDLSGVIQAFFGRPETPRVSTNGLTAARLQSLAKQKANDLLKHWGVPVAFRNQIEFVIAIVPDPIHTHLSLFFDRQIDAITEAAQERGYLFARASMPWALKPPPESSDFKNRQLQEEYRAGKERFPGLMIFHKAEQSGDSEPKQFLFLFVVGESPAGGIERQEFRNALEAIRNIPEGSALPGTLRVLGPTFSGSLYSLMDELKAIGAATFSKVLVRSGTTSSWETIEWFQNYCCRPDNLEFMTFIESDCYLFARFASFAKQR